jgi:hypothetical protein
MTDEAAIIPREFRPHSTICLGLVGTVKANRLIGDKVCVPVAISRREDDIEPADP